MRPELNALQAAGVCHDDCVTMVGAFIPFITGLEGCLACLRIVDKHPEALKPE